MTLEELTQAVQELQRDFIERRDLNAINDDLPSITINKKRVSIPVFSTDPPTCTVGELIISGSDFKVCTAADTWETVTVT